jgi:hypothetical protein
VSTSQLRSELEHLINRHSAENGSDTPDFILAEYLVDCLKIFDKAVKRREEWYVRGTVKAPGITDPVTR